MPQIAIILCFIAAIAQNTSSYFADHSDSNNGIIMTGLNVYKKIIINNDYSVRYLKDEAFCNQSIYCTTLGTTDMSSSFLYDPDDNISDLYNGTLYIDDVQFESVILKQIPFAYKKSSKEEIIFGLGKNTINQSAHIASYLQTTNDLHRQIFSIWGTNTNGGICIGCVPSKFKESTIQWTDQIDSSYWYVNIFQFSIGMTMLTPVHVYIRGEEKYSKLIVMPYTDYLKVVAALSMCTSFNNWLWGATISCNSQSVILSYTIGTKMYLRKVRPYELLSRISYGSADIWEMGIDYFDALWVFDYDNLRLGFALNGGFRYSISALIAMLLIVI